MRIPRPLLFSPRHQPRRTWSVGRVLSKETLGAERRIQQAKAEAETVKEHDAAAAEDERRALAQCLEVQ